MRKSFIYTIIGIALATVSCSDMYRPTKDKVSDDDIFSSSSAAQVYMARLYSTLPIEDFKYQASWGVTYNSWLGSFGLSGTGEAVSREGLCHSFTGEDNMYWGAGYTLIHDANHLIETAPNYSDDLGDAVVDELVGQGYFVRAYTFFKLAQRYGGIPLTTSTIEYSTEKEEMEVPRASEKDTWDQILADFDMAAQFLPEKASAKGYATRFTALAAKADAMLYAGSVAKYNDNVQGRLTGIGEKTGNRVIGFEQSEAPEVSKKYFEEAFKAGMAIVNSGKFSLYRKNSDKYQNMVDMWRDESSTENIWVRYYSYPTLTHGLDAYSSPCLWHSPLSGGTCPTLDFVELFDGLPRYDDGQLRVTDGDTYGEGNYILYDSPYDIFANAEPRLRAYVILPNDYYKNRLIEVRHGIYKGTQTSIQPIANYDYGHAAESYSSLGIADLSIGNSRTENAIDSETNMTLSGSCGPFAHDFEATVTGFHLRKYLNPDMADSEIHEGKSDQPFILYRYADALLAVAEAGVELALAGETTVDGEDVLAQATSAIRDIRDRAGADALTSDLTATVESRNIVRRERRKELAFEHKSKWDIRRWRVIDEDNRDEFWGETRDASLFSNGTRFRFRGLYPFYSTSTGKYFLDEHFQCLADKEYDYHPVDYYWALPSGEVSKSKYIDQQPNR
ncbi:MAG: RagB/SusD family nutrient uptake outer membrane protein [Bacteroidales bacterium]|nr:RagB/SusD family nutrient uptake outer membrane protein [Bacteroidales bacterium]